MKVVLAYSGGLDTSAILVYLRKKGFDVIAFCANIGQDEDFDLVKKRALELGATKVIVEDLREEFAKNYIFPMLRANPEYEGYLLGTSIARPVIAKRQVEIAIEEKADAVAHGATGKGNDQIRFELTYMKFAPHLKIIAPWREWEFKSRKDLVDFLRKEGFNVSYEEKLYSIDENLMHTSFEGGLIEDISKPYPDNIFKKVIPPEKANDNGEEVEIEFERGDPVAVNGERLSCAQIIQKLNEIGGRNGIGIRDVVETRANGMKSRGIYETPGVECILFAKKALEGICLDGNVRKIASMLSPIYSELVYKGLWFSPEREILQVLFDKISERINGKVRLKLYKGNFRILSRESPNSLYKKEAVSFETTGDMVKWAEGFIRTLGLRFLLEKF
ncbi:MAG: argininosuccinate synthase [Candidatus Calescibacterium sp.]|jgi:argininosuccinate synthase|nr:argininosuccinate synthase [Candidatus Calescibacterium sp.]